MKRDRGTRAAHAHDTQGGAPGWDAIDAAVKSIYGDMTPEHWGTVERWRAGGPDPLDGISAFAAKGPPQHWHYVTYGLSELYRKESTDPDLSGWGIELTFRLARDRLYGSAPLWALSFLQYLARYVFESGNVLEPGHHLDLNGPISTSADTEIRAVAFALDPELGHIHTPNGSVEFVQVVGITLDELTITMEWDTHRLLESLAEANPLLVTDPSRRSILDDPARARVVNDAVEREGSSMEGVYVDRLAWHVDHGRLVLTVGAALISRLQALLRGRTRLGRPFWVHGQGRSVFVDPAENDGWEIDPVDQNRLLLKVSIPTADAIARRVRPDAGTYGAMPDFDFAVEPTLIRDQTGRVVDRLG